MVIMLPLPWLQTDKWRECAVNSQRYMLCSSYPRNIFVPAQMKVDRYVHVHVGALIHPLYYRLTLILKKLRNFEAK